MTSYYQNNRLDQTVRQIVDSGLDANNIQDSNLNINVMVPNNSQAQLQSQSQSARLYGDVPQYQCPPKVVMAKQKQIPILRKELVPQYVLCGYKTVNCGYEPIGKLECGEFKLDCSVAKKLSSDTDSFNEDSKNYVTVEVGLRRCKCGSSKRVKKGKKCSSCQKH